MSRILPFVATLLIPLVSAPAAEVSVVNLPRDNDGVYVLNEGGRHEIDWTPETEVALVCNTRQFANLDGNTLTRNF